MTTPQPTPPAPRRAGGFLGRFLAALLVVVITTFLALLTTAAALLALGYTVRTPQDAADARLRAATLEAAQSGMETRVAELDRTLSDHTEALGEIQDEVVVMRELRGDLAAQLESAARQNATMVAEARLSRDQVLAFATAEAGRATLLQELESRSARVERFLQRLSDIAEDTAYDLGVPTATPAAAPPITPPPSPAPLDATPTVSPAPSPSARAAETPSGTPSPPAATATRTTTSQGRAATPSGTPTATP